MPFIICGYSRQPLMTATELSTAAIAFYEENVSYVEAFGLSNLDREDRILFRAGKKLIEDALIAQQSKQERIPFTEEEIAPVLEEYLVSYTMEGQSKVFDRRIAARSMQPFRKDPIASAMGLHGQIVFLDNKNKAIVKSFDRTGKTLKEMLKRYNESIGYTRFNIED
jgi:hypothetical protein